MDLGLTGKRAAVAASTSGLGLGVAVALAQEGARVAICGRDPDRLADALAHLSEQAPDADVVGFTADVGTPDGAAEFVHAAAKALDGLDILVPNAGGPPAGTFMSTPMTAYLPALQLNLLSTVAMCHAGMPTLVEGGWGRIVAITSRTVREPAPQLILSNTARAGATAFLKTLATEFAPRGVTVNSVQPGLHETPRLTELFGGDLTEATSDIPTGHIGRPEDFGAVVAFLCSDQARFITGTSVLVDGGSNRGLS
ncbi:MAG: SDR family oxidoreductase [Aquihabitans sp.]